MSTASLPWTPERLKAEVLAACALETAGSRTQALVALLQEEHIAYAECSSAEVARRRGWVLVALGREPLGDAALPLVLEEMQTGHQPYVLAAAARALRSAGQPQPAFAGCLLRALQTLARRDDFVDLDQWGGAAATMDARTALAEALDTLRWMGPQAKGIKPALTALAAESAGLADDHREALAGILQALPDAADDEEEANCCALPPLWRRRAREASLAAPAASVSFEDQDGAAHAWNDVFVGRPSVVAFFYTRCDNERKCSLTVAKLAQLQKLLAGADAAVNLVAITYDPEFDLPHRLRGYAESRGLVPGPHCRLLRSTGGLGALQVHFGLGVGFAGSLVNRHRIEVYLLDASGRIRAAHERLDWDPAEIAAEIQQLTVAAPAAEPARPRAATVAGAAPTLWALLLALLPKCPVCGAAYLSTTGLMALPQVPGWERYWPLLLLALIVNLSAMAWIARVRRHWGPLAWTVAGTLLLVIAGLALGQQAGLIGGAALTAIGSLLAVLGVRRSGAGRAGLTLGDGQSTSPTSPT